MRAWGGNQKKNGDASAASVVAKGAGQSGESGMSPGRNALYGCGGTRLLAGVLAGGLALGCAAGWAQKPAATDAADREREEAFALERAGSTAEAEAAWKRLAAEEPGRRGQGGAEPWAHLGLLAAREQHYSEAIANYRKALALNAAMPGLRLNLGLAYFKAGDYKNAILQLRPLLKLQAADAEESQRLSILLGMSHYGLAEYASASPYLKEAVAHDGSNLPLLLTLAHSCLLSQQYPCVVDAYHQMVTLNAESAEADMLVGEALDEMKDHAGAEREFRAAVAANPKEANVHFGLGYLQWMKGQYPEAAEEFQAELANDPRHMQAMLYLADAKIQMNQKKDALPILESLMALNPGNSMAHLDLGIVYVDDGQDDKALSEFQTAAKLAPQDANPHWHMGRLYHAMGKDAEAKLEFSKVKSLNKAASDHLVKLMSKMPEPDRATPVQK